MTAWFLREVPFRLGARTIAMQVPEPRPREHSMIVTRGRILTPAGVLDKQPSQPGIVVLHEPVESKSRQRQAREYFLEGSTFDRISSRPKTALLGDVGDDMDDSLGNDAGIDLQKRDRAKGGTDVGEQLKAFFAKVLPQCARMICINPNIQSRQILRGAPPT